MQLCKKSEYAILGLYYIVNRSPREYVKIDELVVKGHLPKALMLKIFNALAKHSILESKPGTHGGFRLKKEPKNISLLEILRIFETSPYLTCCTRKTSCQSTTCRMGTIWKTAQKEIDNVLKNITFDALKTQAQYDKLIPICSSAKNENTP